MMSSVPGSIALDPSSQETSYVVTAPSIGKAVAGSLMRAILETYGKEILESASEQFLDLAIEVRLQTVSTRVLVKLLAQATQEAYGKEILESASEQFLDLALELRLQTISTGELVKLLAQANRLGYQETDTADDEDGAPPVQGGNANARSKPDAIGTRKSPGATAGQIMRSIFCVHFATSSQPLSLEKTRAPSHTNTAQILRDEPFSANTDLNAQEVALPAKEGGYSIQNIQGVAGIQHEVSAVAGTAGKQGQRECSRTKPGPQVAAHVARPRNALKRMRLPDMGGGVQSQRPRKLARAPSGKSSQSISAQPLEIIVISDSEPEPEGNDDH